MTSIYYVILSASRIANATRVWQAACDTSVVDWVKTDDFILATQFGTSKGPLARAYKLQWRNKTDGGSFADVGSTGEISYSATTDLTDDGTLTNTEDSDCTADEPTWQDGLENEGDNICPDTGTYSVADEQYTEFQWALDCSSALDGKEYEFQLYDVTESTVIGVCLATLTIVALGAIEKGFTDSGAGADVFTQIWRAMGFSDVGSGADIFTIGYKAMASVDTGAGGDVFAKVITFQTKAFVDVGSGSDVFILLRFLDFIDAGAGADVITLTRPMYVTDVGGGVDIFSIPYKAMAIMDTGLGTDVFATPFRAMGFADAGSGADVFTVFLFVEFADSGSGVDVFTVPWKGIAKDFADTVLGSEVFVTPYREMGFQDTISGTDIFEMLRFLAFVDSASGSDVFSLLAMMDFSDVGSGADIFATPFRAMRFADVSSGTEVFFLLAEMGFTDVGAGDDVFTKSLIMFTKIIVTTMT